MSRRASTQVVGTATYKGHNYKLYDRTGDQRYHLTLFPRPQDAKGRFGSQHKVKVRARGIGEKTVTATKSARKIHGRTVPVLEADL